MEGKEVFAVLKEHGFVEERKRGMGSVSLGNME